MIDARQIVRARLTKVLDPFLQSLLGERRTSEMQDSTAEFEGGLASSCITVGVGPLYLRLQDRYSVGSAV